VRGRLPLLAAVALLAVSAGCLLGQTERDERDTEAVNPQPTTESQTVHTLTVRAWDEAERDAMPRVEDVDVTQLPRPLDAFQLGPEGEDPPIVLGRFHVPAEARLEAFRMQITVDDGLGPAQLVLDVPTWRADENATVDVHLDLVEPGEAEVARVDGDLPAGADDERADPRYGYLEWPSGDRQPIDGLDRILHVPEAYPRLASEAEPVFRADEPVTWSLDGETRETSEELRPDPGPGRHVLTVEDPDGDGQVDLVFSLHDRFAFQGTVQAGSLDQRSSVAGVNGDSYNLTIGEGARSLLARLEPVGNHTDVENLDLYARNETGAVVDQSTTNGTEEILRLSRSDLAGLDHVQLYVHGEKAALTEYRLSGTVFYWPW
jgi:hypothetical protein